MSETEADREMKALQAFRSALHRFQDAMDAIEDLSSFAEDYAPEEMKDSGDYKITFSTPAADNIPMDDVRAANEALAHFLTQVVESIPEGGKRVLSEKEQEDFRISLRASMDEMGAKLQAASSTEFDAGQYALKMMHMHRTRSRLGVLRSSLLTTAVGDFEVLFSAIVGMYFSLRPQALASKELQFSWQDIQEFDSLDDLRSFHAERQVDQLMWKGFDDWMDWLDKKLKVKFEEIALDAKAVREVFQRRHVIVHNGGQVSRQYLTKTNQGTSSELHIGTRLDVSGEYLSTALDELYALGVLMAGSVADRLFKRSDVRSVIQSHLGDDLKVRYLREERWRVASRISDAYAVMFDSAATKTAMRINCWVARKNADGINSIRKEVQEWDVSPLRDQFKLARMLLLDQHESALSLTRTLAERGDLHSHEYTDDPLYSGLRDWIQAQDLESPFRLVERDLIPEIAELVTKEIQEENNKDANR